MVNLDQEIEKALARVESLKAKKREKEAKNRARFAEALMSALNEIGDADSVSVRALVDLAHAKTHEQDAKRRRAAAKAAASRRDTRSEASNESATQPVWGEQR